MAETESERQERARDLAYQRGQREAEVDGTLLAHERRLAAINGSIERSARAMEALQERLTAMEKAFGEFSAISKALAEKGVSTRTFVVGVLALLVPIIVLYLSSGVRHP